MRAPQQMKVWFTEAIEAKLSSLKLLDVSGKPVPGTSQSSQGDSVLVLNLPSLEGGVYKVEWKVVSVDAHVTNGTISFTVQGPPAPSAPAPANPAPSAPTPANQAPSAPAPANPAPSAPTPANPVTTAPADNSPAPANKTSGLSPMGNQHAPESQKNDALWMWGIAGLVLLTVITGITVMLRSRKA